MAFFEKFEADWGPKLDRRRETFRGIFDYLARRRPTGHLIVETGCARHPNNWVGDGQSTFLFDQFASDFDGQVFSVDLDPTACEQARSVSGPRTTVTNGDSVPHLFKLGRDIVAQQRKIDLLYLDSYDWDPKNPTPCAVHCLKELCAISPALGPGTLVVVDDAFRYLVVYRHGQEGMRVLQDAGVAGKAMLVAEYFQQIGVPPAFEAYQAGWVIPG